MGDIGNIRIHHRIGRMGHMPICEIAGTGCRIAAFRLQRAAVQATAGTFHLGNAAILCDCHGFRTCLLGKGAVMGLPVIKNIPLSVDTLQASMIIRRHVQVILSFPSPISHIAV